MLSLCTPSSPPLPPPPHATVTAPPASVALLREAAARRDAALTSALHAALLKSGALRSPHAPLAATNSLLHAYLQCRLLSRALPLLDETPRRDAATYASLISAHCRLGAPLDALRAFLDMLVLGLPYRDVVSCTAIISGCVLNGMLEEALEVFVMMLEDGVLPNNVTMLSVIQACSLMGASELFSPVHALVVLLELEHDASVVNSLIMMYAKNGFVQDAIWLFKGFYLKSGNACSNEDVLAAVLYGCTISGSMKTGVGVHAHTIKMGAFPSISVENSLMAMYARFEQIDAAHLVFEGMKVKDIVSWNTIISCFAKSDRVNEAMELFSVLHAAAGGLAPDFVTVLSIL
ncbi:unnamed protein product [Miscanthus lutarioriparius]|uniref:Pentatricopeptide repeat-containing protein n=1 Tax=Miscanthus lutarioriparius TaxID=422564 RepID=A0A811PNB5_9POAL|nr:unnamed protein product [Miscanthus lutarioriparius]